MPSVREQFKTYHDFASSSLDEIYGDRLANAGKYQVTTLKSTVFINDGGNDQPHFKAIPLPTLAQISPVFGITSTDVDADGHLDLILAQNFYSPQRETGRMAGGLGLLLKGDDSGKFSSIWPKRSGVVIPEDAKSLVLADTGESKGPDFLVGINNGEMQSWIYQENRNHLIIRLAGGSVLNTGATMTVRWADGTMSCHEFPAGSGYLSQQAPIAFIRNQDLKSIVIRWSDGRKTELHDFSKLKQTERLIIRP